MRRSLAAMGLAGMLALQSSTHAASFLSLGTLGGDSARSAAAGVSADGSVVVGTSYFATGNQAFRWTRDNGMVGLGDLQGGSGGSTATGVSMDGTVVVGTSVTDRTEAFRWTTGGGMTGLGDLPGGDFYSDAAAVSADGSVIVGSSRDSVPGTDCGRCYTYGNHAFRWTHDGGMVSIDQGDQLVDSYATAMSADGRFIAGIRQSSEERVQRIFLWSDASGFEDLGYPSFGPGGRYGPPTAVSPDGSIIVGWNNSECCITVPFRWTASAGFVALADWEHGAEWSQVLAMSADGQRMVGQLGGEASLFDSSGHPQKLLDALLLLGVSGLDGWILNEATAISSDGRWVVGEGTNPFGQREAFLADLQAVPLPTMAWLFGSAFALLGTRATRRYRRSRNRHGPFGPAEQVCVWSEEGTGDILTIRYGERGTSPPQAYFSSGPTG